MIGPEFFLKCSNENFLIQIRYFDDFLAELSHIFPERFRWRLSYIEETGGGHLAMLIGREMLDHLFGQVGVP